MVLVASVGVCGVVVPGTGVLSGAVLEAGCDSCCVGSSAGKSDVWEFASAANTDNAGAAVKIIATEAYAMIFLRTFLHGVLW